MNKKTSTNIKKIGNENSYSKEFFEALYKMIDLKDISAQVDIERSIILATQAYIRYYNEYLKQMAAHEVEKELKKSLNHIDKAAKSLIKIYSSGNYGSDIVNNLYDVIHKKYPSLHSILNSIRRGNGASIIITSPIKSLDLLASMADGIDATLKSYKSKKTTPKSIALYHWIMIISAQLEPIIGHKLEQSRYHRTSKGGTYVSKKEIGDSELLLSIIKPLDADVTISQIETAIKETREERHKAPWNNYFPKG